MQLLSDGGFRQQPSFTAPQSCLSCRIRLDYGDMLVGAGNTDILERSIAELAARYSMQWRVSYGSITKRVAVLVSKLDHCLWDLLIRRDGTYCMQWVNALLGVLARCSDGCCAGQ